MSTKLGAYVCGNPLRFLPSCCSTDTNLVSYDLQTDYGPVGAGPSGIIAGKTLLHDYPNGAFKVTIFEQSERIGGLWPLMPDDDGMVNPEMCTNLSRHTVSFSDMAWPESSPTFPKARQAGQYLKTYASRHSGLEIKTSMKVLKAKRLFSAASDTKQWKVTVEKCKPGLGDILPTLHLGAASKEPLDPHERYIKNNNESSKPSVETYYFDYCIVASGFFGRPKLPPAFSSSLVPIQHSAHFRDIVTLLGGNEARVPNKGDKILVVGGSMSAAEVAASIAMQLSSHVHSPGAYHMRDADKYTVHHIMKRPFWVMPLFLPANPLLEGNLDASQKFNPAPNFLPLDIVMYDMAKRPPGPIKNNSGYIATERANSINKYLETFVGTNQSDLLRPGSDRHAGALTMEGEILNAAPWLAITDTYGEFVRSGRILLDSGELLGIRDDNSSESASVIVSIGGKEQVIDGVAAVVLATGFEATGSLNFLAEDVLQILGYDTKCPPLPLALDMHSTVHRDIPDLGFVGFYRGPFWGVMEMQARYLGRLWTGDERAQKALNESTSPIPELRKCYYDTPKQFAQFPMGDYTYLMESFRETLGIEVKGEPRQGPVLPARYLVPNASDEAQKQSFEALSAVGRLHSDSNEHGKFVARAIFRSLQGDWSLQRSLISSISTYPSGSFCGSAKFFPRYPTAPEYSLEHLYFEEGDFETETGLKFKANRRYIYRYNETSDTLSTWFAKMDNKSVDYLFHELEILLPENGSGWRAKAHHLCIDDMYDVEYEFRFRGASVEQWTQSYSVKGPQKDYRIQNSYRR